ncbi:MAG: hypothetical protein ACRDYD_03550 [Acidimicrobiales bacterium]
MAETGGRTGITEREGGEARGALSRRRMLARTAAAGAVVVWAVPVVEAVGVRAAVASTVPPHITPPALPLGSLSWFAVELSFQSGGSTYYFVEKLDVDAGGGGRLYDPSTGHPSLPVGGGRFLPNSDVPNSSLATFLTSTGSLPSGLPSSYLPSGSGSADVGMTLTGGAIDLTVVWVAAHGGLPRSSGYGTFSTDPSPPPTKGSVGVFESLSGVTLPALQSLVFPVSG